MNKKITFKSVNNIRNSEANIAIDKWVNNEAITKQEIAMTRLNVDISSALHKRIKTYCANNEIKIKDKIIDMLMKEFPEN